jgi:hypothetical protein
LDESDNVETEPYLQAVREALDDKFDNVITLCTKEIDKPGKSVCGTVSRIRAFIVSKQGNNDRMTLTR